ncbi:MAG TPA: prolyl oligopeptidase family serine peptidase [Bacteroidia bacterium]|jgi:S-formylglutathione hydrolase FrmB|nr:prolyl oligopeptidase family serine peptidase [Bacteroidia bacterium]
MKNTALTFLFFSLSIFTIRAQRDTTVYIHTRAVDILYPEGRAKGTILMLPGWNFSRKKTCEQSNFCTQAVKAGFVLICPEMGKSLYASAVYPESRKEWAGYPQLHFITDTLEPYLQKQFNLLKKGQKNFIYGISTGARGGALILEHSDSLFCAAALLSGDYDQLLDPKDNLMNGYYGSSTQFKSRWEGEDNPCKQADKIKASVYLGHGRKDAVVAYLQTLVFYEALQKYNVKRKLGTQEEAGHTYAFWGSQTEEVLNYFEEKL